MIEIIKELNIEVSKPNIFQAVVAKQYDMNTRFIKATFVDGADIIRIPKTATAKVVINADMPDGSKGAYDGEVNDDGTVTVPLHSEMLKIDGTVVCDISVIDTATDNNKKLTTTSFTLMVEKAAYGGDDITNDPQYDVLVSLIEECTEATEAAKEVAKGIAVDKTFNSTSENAQSGIAVEERVKSKVLVDVTLTEEQAGASSVMVAIPNPTLLKKAKCWNVRITFPYTEVLAANKMSTTVSIRDINASATNMAIASCSNIAFTSSSNVAHFIATVFNTSYGFRSGGGSYISHYMPINPWVSASVANSKTSPSCVAYHYRDYNISESYPPYLEIKDTSGFVFGVGTKIFLEVIE